MFNHVLRNDEVNRQGIIPDMTLRMSGNTPESIGPPTTIYENVDSLLDVKTLAPGQAYHKSAAAQAGERAAVEHRQEQVNKDYYAIIIPGKGMQGQSKKSSANLVTKGKLLAL